MEFFRRVIMRDEAYLMIDSSHLNGALQVGAAVLLDTSFENVVTRDVSFSLAPVQTLEPTDTSQNTVR